MSESQNSDRSIFRRFIIPIGLLVLLLSVEVINWTTEITSERLMPKFGTSAQSVLGQMFALLVGVLLLVWLLFTKQVSWKRKGIVFGIVGLLAGGLALSIREIENTGNNNKVIRFRWEPTQDQRLDEYQKSAKQPGNSITLDATAPRFTNFLGLHRDGVVSGNKLITDLKASPPSDIWRRPVGGGYAGCVMAGGLAVTIEQRAEEEVVVAFDMKTGADRWTRGYPGHFKESLGGNGPRATPTIADNEVFALGASGLLVSLNLATGDENWQTNILTDAKATNIQWGMSGAPLVTESLVIVNPGGANGNGVAAYDRATGERKWSGGDNKAGYSSPVLAEISGVAQVLIFDANGVAGHALETGTELWRHPFSTLNGINVAQPLVLPDDQVFVSAGYNAGALLLKVRNSDGQWSSEPVWQNKQMKCKMSSAIFQNGFVYGLDDGILCCLDAETGKRKWKRGRYGHGQLLLCSDVLVIMGEAGDLILVAVNPEEHVELAKLPILPGGKTWNAPALAGNKLLLRNHFEAVLLELTVSD